MDIHQRLTSDLNRPLTAQVSDRFMLKLAQTVEAKVIEINREQQTLILALSQPKNTIQVTTDNPNAIQKGETLELKVTQTQPALQFEKVPPTESKSTPAQAVDDKPANIEKAVVFKQVITDPNLQSTQSLTAGTKKLPTDVIEAKVVQIRDGTVQLKLTYDPFTESVTYHKSSNAEFLNQKNPQIALTPQQLFTANDQPLPERFIANLKTDQSLFLQLKSTVLRPEFRVLTEQQVQNLLQNQSSALNTTRSLTEIQLPISAINPKILLARVLEVNDVSVRLKLLPQPTELSTTFAKNLNETPLLLKNPVITLSSQQLFTDEDQPLPNRSIQDFRPGQMLILEIKKEGPQPEFRLLPLEKALTPQVPASLLQSTASTIDPKVVTAEVLRVTDQGLQLKLLSPSAESISNLAKIPIEGRSLSSDAVITLDTQQFVTTKNQPLPDSLITQIKPGQTLFFEIQPADVPDKFRLVPADPALATKSSQAPVPNSNELLSITPVNPKILAAQVLQVADQTLQLKLLPQPVESTTTYAQNPTELQGVPKDSIITLSHRQLLTTENQPLADKSIAQFKPGQTLFFEIQPANVPDKFRLVPADQALATKSSPVSAPNSNELSSIAPVNPKILAAQVLQVNDQTLQLKLLSQPVESTTTYAQNSTELQGLPKDSIITLSHRQLLTTENQPLADKAITQLKPGQSLVLEISKEGSKPELRLLASQFKPLVAGQSFQAKVIAFQAHQVILQPSEFSAGSSGTQAIDPLMSHFRLTVPNHQIQLPDGKLLSESPATITQGADLKITVATNGNESILKITPPSVPESPKPLPIIEAQVVSISAHKIEVALPANTTLPINTNAALLTPQNQTDNPNRLILTLRPDNFDFTPPAPSSSGKAVHAPVVASDPKPVNLTPSEITQTQSSVRSTNGGLPTHSVVSEKAPLPPEIPSQISPNASTPIPEISANITSAPLSHLSTSSESTETQRVNAVQLHNAPKPPPLATPKNMDSTLPKATDFQNLALKVGQKIHLQVSEQQGQVRFNQVSEPVSYDKLIETTIKQMIPIQQSPAELMNTLANHFQELTRSATVPEALKKIAKAIMAELNQYQPSEYSGKTLQKTLQHSGLFLEARAFQTEPSPLTLNTDLKNQLLHLKQSVEQALQKDNQSQSSNSNHEQNLFKELQSKTENALARILLNQFQSLPKEDSNRQVWVMDLPVWRDQQADSVKVSIEKRKSHSEDDTDDNWQVQLTLKPPGLEPIHCRITHFERKIDTLFWSDSPKTTEKVEKNLDYLRQQFEQAGLKVGQISAQTVKNNTPSEPLWVDSLLDQRV